MCKCLEKDKQNKEFISKEEWLSVLDSLKLEFSEDQIKYILLLFYSFEKNLDKIQYKDFVTAYDVPESEFMVGD